jgi:predicted nucleic acid-binding protein
VSYLIDTNVLSELRRNTPDSAVVSWFQNRPPASLYLSVLTLGEIRKGIEMLSAGSRQLALRDWLDVDLPTFFTGRILAVDGAVADRWGRIVAAAGRPVAAVDSLLAATAATHDLFLVTRNVKDFVAMPVTTINPWDPEER